VHSEEELKLEWCSVPEIIEIKVSFRLGSRALPLSGALGTVHSPHQFTPTKDDDKIRSNSCDDFLVGRQGSLSGHPMRESVAWLERIRRDRRKQGSQRPGLARGLEVLKEFEHIIDERASMRDEGKS
jgi:hypothetical protein